jgi:hypothetical protein
VCRLDAGRKVGKKRIVTFAVDTDTSCRNVNFRSLARVKGHPLPRDNCFYAGETTGPTDVGPTLAHGVHKK